MKHEALHNGVFQFLKQRRWSEEEDGWSYGSGVMSLCRCAVNVCDMAWYDVVYTLKIKKYRRETIWYIG
ncbi:unnamed protein product [Trifolium pratense]|uniref:Uncharacterized protein n=1 Tax=Trifolium pratense TaxID=57577 RepID=A0ACB0JTZ2_TRIPR|nr:unnamed protein product [Trifolium pratense]